MKIPDNEYFISTKSQVETLLNQIVGFQTEVYWGKSDLTGVGSGDSYQIMPFHSEDEGDFWHWHLTNNQQWFESPLDAAVSFAEKHRIFQKTAKK